MRFDFKKITSVIASTLMLGSTIGIAAAANYPAPFVSGSSHDVAIVYGTSADVLDGTQAKSIQVDLESQLSTTSTSTTSSTATGGDSIKLERSTDKFNLGDAATSVYITTIDEGELPDLLAEGTYMDDDNNEYNYDQKVELGTLSLSHFASSEYEDSKPTIGFNISTDQAIINYTLNFKKNPTFNATYMETTDLTLLGKTYYVLDIAADTNVTTLLDSASSVVLGEGEETTVTTAAGDPYTVGVSFITSTSVRLEVNGETTNSINIGGTYKLSDGSYVGIKDILYNSKTGTTSSVEFSIGKGKLELDAVGGNVELNDESIEGLTSWMFTSGMGLNKVVIEWKAFDETFLTPEQELVMPGFEAIKLTMGNVVVPAMEEISLTYDGDDKILLTAPIVDGDANIYLLYANASTSGFLGIGKGASDKLATSSSTTLGYNYSNGDRNFILSWASSTEAESYMLAIASGGFNKASSSEAESITIKNAITGTNVCEDITDGETCEIGNSVLTLSNIYANTSTERSVTLTATAGSSFNKLYTAEGLKIHLPYDGVDTGHGEINLTDSVNPTSLNIFFEEEDKDGSIASATGNNFTIQAGFSGTETTVSRSDSLFGAGTYETEDGSKDYEGYVESDLATKAVFDTGGDQDKVTITYHGSQMYADVFVADTGVTVGSGSTGALGNVAVTDGELDSVKTKNLIVVGGSCVNDVAAELLGGAYCSEDFTAATGIGDGQFLIKVMDSPYATNKIALLVAGYEKEDTQKGTTYLTTQTVPTAVGTELKKESTSYVDVA
jgi:hypothetical protein